MEEIKKFISDHFTMVGEEHGIDIKYDGELLLNKRNMRFSSWSYVKKENDKTIYEHIKPFEDKYFNLILDDIAEQLMNGADRNNLKINVPHELSRIKIGDKIIEV